MDCRVGGGLVPHQWVNPPRSYSPPYSSAFLPSSVCELRDAPALGTFCGLRDRPRPPPPRGGGSHPLTRSFVVLGAGGEVGVSRP